jgi:hypothetical protein
LLFSVLLSGQVRALGVADVTAEEIMQDDVEYYTKLAEGCGEHADNLLCYYTPEEIQEGSRRL